MDVNSEWARLVKLKADSDLLVVRDEENLDYHKGVLHDVTEDVVRFELDGEMLPVKRSKVYGFVYRHATEPDLPPAVCRITDCRRLAMVGPIARAGRRVAMDHARRSESVAAAGQVVEIDFSGGKIVYLSDMEPENRSIGLPILRREVRCPRRNSSTRRAATAASNRRAAAIGRHANMRKGLALYCRTEMVYRLPARFSRFQAVAGIDDAVRPSGKVRLIDPRRRQGAAGSRHSGSDPPRTVDLDLTGVRRLTIVVDFAGSLSTGDRLLLCNARVSK